MLDGGVTRARGTLDSGGGQTFDVERVAQHFEQPQLFLAGLLVRRRDVAGQDVGGVPQAFGQRVADLSDCIVEPVLQEARDGRGPVGETSGSTDIRNLLQVFRGFLTVCVVSKAVSCVWNAKTATLTTTLLLWLAAGQI